MENYAHYIDTTTITYPTDAEFKGVPNWRTHDALLRKRKYVPLVCAAEPREGYTIVPTAFEFVQQSTTRIEPRPYEEDVYEDQPDPEHEGETIRVKVGTRTVWRDTEIQVDTSYINALEWRYDEILPPPATLADYNDALEAYLREVRYARGYTDRDPSEYYNSSVERWAQDARDWIAFRDRVMLYALEVLTEYEESGVAPCTLAEFDAALREIVIEWSEE